MSIIIANNPLSKIFANSKPVRKVVAANQDGTGQEVVFNTVPFTVQVNITAQSAGSSQTNFTLTVVNNSPYAETFYFCLGYDGWKSEHADDLDKTEDYWNDQETMYPATVNLLKSLGILSEFVIEGNSSKVFSYSLSSTNVPAKIRLLRKNDDDDYKLLFYNGSLADKYNRYLIFIYYTTGNLSYTYNIDETIV